jgi:hypothetical protein
MKWMGVGLLVTVDGGITSVLACVPLLSGLKTFLHEILWDTTP